MIWSAPTSDPTIPVPVVGSANASTRSGGTHRCRTLTLTVVSIALLAGLAFSRRHDLAEALRALTGSSPAPIIAAVSLSLVGVLNRASQYRWAHDVAGVATGTRSMVRISAASYALNKVVKTGGVGGLTLFVRTGRRRGHSARSVVAACVVNSLSNQFAMLALTVVALVALTRTGSALQAWTPIIGGIVLMLTGALIALVLVGLRSRDLADRWFPVPFAILGRVALRLGMSAPPVPGPEQFDRVFEVIDTVRREPARVLPVVAHAVAAKLIGATVLAISLLAVRADIAPGPVLVVYVLTLAAAATTILPGGLGAVEATMTLTLTSYGVPTSTALAGTIIFRFLDLWVPVLLGLLAAPGLDRSTARSERRRAEAWVPGTSRISFRPLSAGLHRAGR